MRFRCDDCSVEFTSPADYLGVQYINDEDGTVSSAAPVSWDAPCPRCRKMVPALNQASVGDPNSLIITGPADTAEELEALQQRLLELLKSMDEDASFEDVLRTVESAPDYWWFFAWLVRHKDLLTALTASTALVQILILLVGALIPDAPEPATPPVQPGVTHEQMAELLEELRKAQPPPPTAPPARPEVDPAHSPRPQP